MPKKFHDADDRMQKVITMRLHRHLVERIDALIPIMQENEELSPNANSGRSHVIRTLIQLGLETFEG